MAGGLLAWLEYPDQLELIRWATPVKETQFVGGVKHLPILYHIRPAVTAAS